MEKPSELIRRARANQNRKTSPEPRMESLRQPVPLRHGAYSELMRSHDRVATRHVAGKN